MPKTIFPMNRFADAADREALRLETRQGEDERLHLLREFPREGWAELSLERYAYGPDESKKTFSSMLENETNNLAPFESHGSKEFKIYFSQVEQRWWYVGNFGDGQKAWQAIRESYLRGFAIAEAGRWNQLHKVNTGRYGTKALLKTLICYFPDELMPIASKNEIARFLKMIRVVDFDDSAKNVINLNRLLLVKLRQKAAVDDWTPAELKQLLYAWASPEARDDEWSKII